MPLVAGSLAQPAAGSPTDIPDAVDLADGSFLRGTLLAIEAGSHVTLRLPSGEERRLPWAMVRGITRDGQPVPINGATVPTPVSSAPAPVSMTAAPVSTTPAPVSAEPLQLGEEQIFPGSRAVLAGVPGPRVRLDVDANTTSMLQRRIGGQPKDNVVGANNICNIPCNVMLPANDTQPYRIADPLVEPTEWFLLPKHDARIRADLVQRTWGMWPIAFLVGSAGTALAGGITWVAQEAGEDDMTPGTGPRVLGILSGSFLLAAGLFWLAAPETSMTVEPLK